MTDPTQAAIEKAEEACPCRPAHDDVLMDIGIRTIQPCVNGCICYFGKVSIKPTTACLWPGHAAIRSLAALVREYGHGRRCHCHAAIGEGSCGSVMSKMEPCYGAVHPYRDPDCLPESREVKP